MAEAYCVKDKMKVEVVNPAEDHDEERQAGAPGHVPEVRWQGLQDRRLTPPSTKIEHGPCRQRRGPFDSVPVGRLTHWRRVARLGDRVRTYRNRPEPRGRSARRLRP